MKYDGKTWLKVFYHNCTGKNYLDNQYSALNINEDNKYSILSYINDQHKINSKYEFILEWPEYKTFYHWRQTNNPVQELETSGVYMAKGFEPIHNGSEDSHCWGGLVRTTLPNNGAINSLLDGCPGINLWYFTIGMYKDSDTSWNDIGYPMVKDHIATSIVYLWMRTNTSSDHYISCKTQRGRSFISSVLFQ